MATRRYGEADFGNTPAPVYGDIKRGQAPAQNRFQPPSAGVAPDFSGKQMMISQAQPGSIVRPIMDVASQRWWMSGGGSRQQQQQVGPTSAQRQKRARGIAMAKAVQKKNALQQARNQPAPAPFTSLSSPTAQINQALANWQQPQAPSSSLSSPIGQAAQGVAEFGRRTMSTTTGIGGVAQSVAQSQRQPMSLDTGIGAINQNLGATFSSKPATAPTNPFPSPTNPLPFNKGPITWNMPAEETGPSEESVKNFLLNKEGYTSPAKSRTMGRPPK